MNLVLRVFVLTLVLLGSLLVAPPSLAQPMQADGPHASATRTVAPVQESRSDGVRVIRFDLGNLELTDTPGQYVSPLRGSLVLPDAPGSHSLVVVNHLRSFGCTGQAFAYPCPAGSQDIRLDQGMEYLGVALAKRGYAVLIPDLSPTLLAATSSSNYPMGAASAKVVTAQRDRLMREPYGASIASSPAALITHSRSGLFAPELIAAWRDSATPITSLLALAPAYDIGSTWSPAPPDIPYLGLYGSLDDDVPFMAATYLTHHLGSSRTAPAFAVQVPGYGHMFFNQALRNDDDRKSCSSGGCRTAAQHEELLVKAAASWVDAALRPDATAPLPRAASGPLPTTLWGEPVAMVALTPGPHVSLLAGSEGEASAVAVAGGVSAVCRMMDPANPNRPADRCPEPGEATVLTQDIPLRHVVLNAGGSLTYRPPTDPRPAAAVALHLSPFDNQPGGHPLRLTFADAAGATCLVDLPGDHPVLATRKTAADNGTYVVGTLRVPVCSGVDAAHLASLALSAPTGKADLLVRGVDVIPAAGPTPSPTPTVSPTAVPPSAPPPSAAPTDDLGRLLVGAAIIVVGTVIASVVRRQRGRR